MSVESVPPTPARRPPSRKPEDELTEVAGSLDRLTIDGSDLDQIRQYLKGVQQLTLALKQMAKNADQAARTDDLVHGPYSSLGSPEIGFMLQISARLQATERHMSENLTKFATAVDDTAEATKRLAADYQDADKRNKLSFEQVTQILRG